MSVGKKLKGILKLPNIAVGTVLALFYLMLILLIPSQVKSVRGALTDAKMYPYVVFSLTSALAIFFAVTYRKIRYEIDFGIWPMVLGGFLFYFAIQVVGFYIATVLTILYNTWFWRYKNWRVITAVAIATPVLIYVFFSLCMRINLPSGMLF